jgi:hypothetical protein
MNNKLMGFLFIVAILSTVQLLSGSPDEYWISFISFRDSPQGSGPPHVMKIDVLGNVLIPQTPVVPLGLGYIAGGATALSQTDDFLILWLPDSHAKDGYRVFRAVIRKQPLRVVSLRKTPLRVANRHSSRHSAKKRQFPCVAAQAAI